MKIPHILNNYLFCLFIFLNFEGFSASLSVKPNKQVNNNVGVIASLSAILGLSNSTVCKGESIQLTAVGLGGIPPYTFSWSENGVPLSFSSSSISVIPPSSGNGNDTHSTYCVTITDASGASSMSCSGCTVREIIQNPEITPSNTTVCSDVAFSISAFAPTSLPSVTYQWLESNDVSGIPATNIGTNTQSLNINGINNITNAVLRKYYKRLTSYGSGLHCEVSSDITYVDILPEPVGNNSTHEYNSNEIFSINLPDKITNLTGNTFAWSVTSSNPTAIIPSPASGTSNTISGQYINTTNQDIDLVYTVIPTSAAGCMGGAFTVTVKIKKSDCGTNLQGTLKSSQTITGNRTLSGNLTITGAGTIVTFDALSLNANAITRTITVTGGATLKVINNSVLSVCAPNTRWVGIRVASTGQIEMLNSTISNATIGIQITNPVNNNNNQIWSSNFNDNVTGIKLALTTGSWIGSWRTIYQNVFSNTLNNNTGTGINISGAVDISIMVNEFNGLNIGITASNTSANIGNITCSDNNFNNMNSLGISRNGNYYGSVYSNNFSNLTTKAKAIKITNDTLANGSIYVAHNTILNYIEGILCENIDVGYVTQTRNIITWNNNSGVTSRFGIHNINVASTNLVRIEENQVNFIDDNFVSHTGFMLQDCENVEVKCNRVSNSISTATNRIGFDFYRTNTTTTGKFLNCVVSNNSDFGSNIGFRFRKPTPASTNFITFMGNRMENNSIAGLQLQNWNIGNQGNVTTACWNRWHGSKIVATPAIMPKPIFFTSVSTLPETLTGVAKGGCTFTLSSDDGSYASPCNAPILYKTQQVNQNITGIDNNNLAIEVETPIEKHEFNDKFYPSPATNRATYEIELADNQSGNVQVFDLAGKMLSQKDLTGGYNKVEFDLSETPNGMYIYKVTSDKTVVKTGKFVVQK